jgi:hypothetical protein
MLQPELLALRARFQAAHDDHALMQPVGNQHLRSFVSVLF